MGGAHYGHKTGDMSSTLEGTLSTAVRARSRRPSNGNGSIGYAVLGGGPAGLTGAYTFGLRGCPAVVFEADGSVGGIAKTVEFNGYRFDLGGHRFFTKLKDRKSTRLNSSHIQKSRMPSSA